MLSDMYISIYNNPSSTVIVDSTEVDKYSATCHDDSAISSTQFDYGTYSIDVQNLCVLHKKENVSSGKCLLFFYFFKLFDMFEDNSCFTIQNYVLF